MLNFYRNGRKMVFKSLKIKSLKPAETLETVFCEKIQVLVVK